ncbi:kama family protein [Melanomma pulvis-pyrius CBS 109.77]|uniref:Kama family protein n=1 Tax=Melanomma pulvis-pyrius CBS 109.77 TaxID=1314802 RepID=A0A6A6XY12_9PLEO|nr:kama family protein [Melanomma pulvis-pyrius CBS 109.77]
MYWRRVPKWKDVSQEQFISYQWTMSNTVNSESYLCNFLNTTLPNILTPSSDPLLRHIKTKDHFIQDAMNAFAAAPMAIRLTPHILSVVDWTAPLDDPVRRQFIPLASSFVTDHPKLTLDSLHEKQDSPVPGLVHRYPDKALFLATSICPVYCRFCTRSYAVGGNTKLVTKTPQKPSRRRWQVVFEHIEKTPALSDIVVSGGDTFYLTPQNIMEIGNRLLSIDHIKRIRFASKGLAVAPGRILDPSDDWTKALVSLSNKARGMGKHVCLHTHFNHPSEISWITKKAARYLFENNIIVRNQSVLLKGVNDSVETMGKLIRDLADMNIQPYYVYQCDLVRGIEDLRTPLSTILNLEQHLRGTIAGFMMPSFVVDLPGGGGKRLAASYDSYDAASGVSTFKAPGLPGEKAQKVYKYYDPRKRDDETIAALEGSV